MSEQEGPYKLEGDTEGAPLFTGPAALEIEQVLDGEFNGQEHVACNIAFREGQLASKKEIAEMRGALDELVNAAFDYVDRCSNHPQEIAVRFWVCAGEEQEFQCVDCTKRVQYKTGEYHEHDFGKLLKAALFHQKEPK